jgi:hypothetical protein
MIEMDISEVINPLVSVFLEYIKHHSLQKQTKLKIDKVKKLSWLFFKFR